MSNKTKTAAQQERQDTRSEGTGRYRRLNPCEGCPRSAGANFFSDRRCNSTGKGLVLCKRCADALCDVPDAEYLAWFEARRQG